MFVLPIPYNLIVPYYRLQNIEQNRANEKREIRRAGLGPLHRRIISLVAAWFHIQPTVAEESMLDECALEMVNHFLESRRAIHCLAVCPLQTKPQCGGYIEKVIYVEPSEAFAGEISLFLVKCGTSEPVSEENFREVVHCTYFQRSNQYLRPIYELIANLFLPLIQCQKSWLGSLQPQYKSSFVNDVEDYLAALDCACSCLTENVKLACCREVKSENLRDNTRFVELSQNLTSLGTVEECACRWMQQISLEIRELHLVRKESNTDGPHAEMNFWKRRMTRLNSLIDQLKLQEVINVKTILKLAQSKTLSVGCANHYWKVLNEFAMTV
ncbi:hypothetical protein P879_05505 [Paragonimus westermani]|uniref:Dynein heavy chain tail domain-containing protein n=1 Tax=Paragonimus westermani TaxID=34504 RepID=A0A8T0DFK6_9TREM|nr:hypothetical protein P879_05505 [Paragonimus westermani]